MRASYGLLVLLSGFLVNCARTAQFSDTPVAAVDTASTTNMVSEKFTVTSQNISTSKPLDIIWVVDNSGSMNEEASLVRKNLSAFLNLLKSNSSVHFLLVSELGTTGTNVSVPSGFAASEVKSLDLNIGSRDGPAKLLGALPSFISSNAGFFRTDSKKIVVFVTDDDSLMASNTFLTSLESITSWRAADISVFGFIGLGDGVSSCQARTGAVYSTLADTTGGKVYNICLSDWSANFTALSTNIISKVQIKNTFTLKSAKISKVLTLKVGGADIDAKYYSVAGNILTIAAPVNLQAGAAVEIQYIDAK